MNMLPLDEEQPDLPRSDAKVLDVGDIPKELAIYQKTEGDFLPPGKDLNDLTPEELNHLKSQYRFSPFRPGLYQTITGYGGSG